MLVNVQCPECNAPIQVEAHYEPGVKPTWGYAGGDPGERPYWIIETDVVCDECHYVATDTQIDEMEEELFNQ